MAVSNSSHTPTSLSHPLSLPEGAQVRQDFNEAMRAIEKDNLDLADVLTKS